MARSRAVSSTMWLVFPAASGFQPMRNAALRPSLRVQAATLCQPHQNFPLLPHTPRSTSDGDLRLAVLGGPTQVGPRRIGWLNCITLSNEGRSEQRALSRRSGRVVRPGLVAPLPRRSGHYVDPIGSGWCVHGHSGDRQRPRSPDGDASLNRHLAGTRLGAAASLACSPPPQRSSSSTAPPAAHPAAHHLIRVSCRRRLGTGNGPALLPGSEP